MKLASLMLISLALTFACSSSTEESADTPAVTEEPVPAGAAAGANADLSAKLAAADQLDGAADHVVGKCPGCKLGMNGKSENALDLAGYSLHFCSAGCKDGFAGDAEAKMLALSIP